MATNTNEVGYLAQYLKPTDAGFREASNLLRRGKLVAFPTETVYGLGANAFDEQAVRSIFETKKRPLSDPLIVHVSSLDQGLGLVEMSEEGQSVFRTLASAFWPGALTLIARAVPQLPSCITANTGFVGIRYPSHPLAQRLICEAQLPIAAPSANRFGHVSPTLASHVMNDLGDSPIAILDGDGEEAEARASTCEHGIESTVCKIDAEAKCLIVYRQGAVPLAAIQRSLEENQLDDYKIEVVRKFVPMPDESKQKVTENYQSNSPAPSKKLKTQEYAINAEEEKDVGEAAPGQLITHYAPDVETFLVNPEEWTQEKYEAALENSTLSPHLDLSRAVVIDYGCHLSWLKGKVVAYSNLSPSSNMKEAGRNLFASLRWAETIENAKAVLLPDLSKELDENAGGVADRMFRSASGKYSELVCSQSVGQHETENGELGAAVGNKVASGGETAVPVC